MSLKLKEFHNDQKEEQKAIEDFFISESSEEEESEVLFERLAETPRRIQMKLRKHKFEEKQDQNPSEYTENTSPTLQNIEGLETKRKMIKKI